MSYRPRLIMILSLVVLFTLTLSACNRERPVPTTTTTTPAAARGTVTAPTPGAAGTEGAAPTTGGTTSAPTPIAPSPQQVVVSPSAPGTAGSGQAFSYTVVAGDTLATIAARFGTTTEAIARLNSLADPNALTLGQKLQIPGAGTGAAGAATTSGGAATTGTTSGGETRSGTSTYTVVAGDTLGKIAQRFGTTVAELQRLNNISNPDMLSLGQKLIVPGSSGGAAVAVPTGGQGRTYVVQRGDTLLSIARRFGLTVKQLQTANNISNPDRIAVGQKLIIP